MKKCKRCIANALICSGLLLFTARICSAQTSYVDSLYFTTVFQTPIYQNYYDADGDWYIHPFIQTRQELFNKLDNLMKFRGEEYYGSYKNIVMGDFIPLESLNKSMNYYYGLNPLYGYKQLDPVWSLGFSLNGKKSTAYCTYSPTTKTDNSDCKTAILFITGSGTNNGTEMIRGQGYQNIYGYQKNLLAAVGDVYIAIRPLIDFRALVWDNYGKPMALNSEFPHPSQITSYLNGRGTPYGVNCLIESIALVKYLKSKYQKVIIAGLSYGGIYTTLNAFESSPEGALISGGYTIAIDEIGDNNYQVPSFGDLFFSLTRDSVKANIEKSTTQFLFSWGRIEDTYLETVLRYTESYFTGLKNTQYFYDYDYHTFPPFQAFKNLIDSIKNHPTVRVKKSERSSTKVEMMVLLNGQKPYKFDLFKDSVLYNSYTSISDTFYINLNAAGVYKIRNLFDGTNIAGFNSDDYVFKPNENIGISLLGQSWDCESQTQKQIYRLTGGSGPWDIYYRENGKAKSVIYNTTNSLEFNWAEGIYIIDSINNYGNSMKYINDTIVVNSNFSIQSVFNSIIPICNSDLTQFTLNAGFKNYKNILYQVNGGEGSSRQIENDTILLSTGVYQISGLQSPDGCVVPLNFTYTTENIPFDKTSIFSEGMQVQTRNFGMTYFWYNNGIAFDTTDVPQTNFIGNGNYEVRVINSRGCLLRTEKKYINKDNLTTYPNPFNENFDLFIELPINESATLDMYNALGIKVKSFQIKRGVNHLVLQGNNKGIYFLKVRYKKGYIFDTIKMIKL